MNILELPPLSINPLTKVFMDNEMVLGSEDYKRSRSVILDDIAALQERVTFIEHYWYGSVNVPVTNREWFNASLNSEELEWYETYIVDCISFTSTMMGFTESMDHELYRVHLYSSTLVFDGSTGGFDAPTLGPLINHPELHDSAKSTVVFIGSDVFVRADEYANVNWDGIYAAGQLYNSVYGLTHPDEGYTEDGDDVGIWRDNVIKTELLTMKDIPIIDSETTMGDFLFMKFMDDVYSQLQEYDNTLDQLLRAVRYPQYIKI